MKQRSASVGRKKKPSPPSRQHRLGNSELGAAAKQFEAAASNTSKEVLISKYGAERYQEHPDGSWTVALKSQSEVDAFDEMDRPRQRLESEAANGLFASVPQTVLKTSDGRAHAVDADHADYAVAMAERNGVAVHERMRYRPSAIYKATPSGLVRVR